MRDRLAAWVFCAALACISIAIQGFAFGAGNNVFHIPIVQHAYAWPQFSGDAYYQGLKSYTSMFWSALGLLGPAAANETVFLALHLIIRTLTIAAIYHLLGHLKLSNWPRFAALTVIAFSPFISGSSIVGDHDLFIYYLNHTSACWPLLFLSLVLLSNGKITTAFALNGILFALNAFVAVWHGAALAAGALALILAAPERTSEIIKRAGLGFLAALIIGAPVLIWVLTATTPEYAPFSYRAFLREYWPNHFFLDASSLREQIKLLVIFATGAIALWRLEARILLWAFGAYTDPNSRVSRFRLEGLNALLCRSAL